MAARCPHKKNECDADDSKQCHYISTATSSAATMLATLQMLRMADPQAAENLPPSIKQHAREMSEFLASVQGSP